jgi:hypothetical protein
MHLNIGDAKAHFSKLVAPIRSTGDVRAAIAEIRAARHGHAPTTAQEIPPWRDEGHRDR